MAIFIPKTQVNLPQSEKEALNSLKSLDDEHYIFHSTNWFNSDSGEEGEGDIIILNRMKGVRIFEIKGGAIEYRDGEIRQINSKTFKYDVIKDPFKQANRTKHYIIKLLKNLSGRLNCFVHSAVWFTGGALMGKLPIAFDRKSVFTQDDLYAANYSVNDLFKHISEYDNYRHNLNQTEFTQIINLLAPSFSIIQNKKYEYDKREEEFLKFTNEQTKILDILQYLEKAVIEGSAGTGKTALAIEKANRLSLENKEVLFLCYNKKLKSFLEKHYYNPNIKFQTIYGLMSELLSEELAENYDELENKFIEYMMSNSNSWIYDNVIIDEAQDIKNDLLEAIELRVNGTLYIFYDPNQNLYSEETPKVIGGIANKFPLTVNCRNTKEIATTASKFLDLEYKEVLNFVVGEKPKFYEVTDNNENIKLVKTIIDNSLKNGVKHEDIAVITMKGESKSEFNTERFSIKGIQ